MRIDKYIWTIRLFKTRSLASKACQAEKVKLNGEFAKAAKTVSIDSTVSIKVPPIWRTFKVIDIPKSRVGAKLVCNYMIETTSLSDLEQLNLVNQQNKQNKLLGIKGRPTKKDRRDLDKRNI